MKAIRMILRGTVFFTVVIAIMLAPAMIMATCFGVSQMMFLTLLIPCSVLGFLIGFQVISWAVDKGLFENLLN